MTWRLRRASIDDAPAVAALARATFFATFASLLLADDMAAHCDRNSSAERFAAWASDPGIVLTVAEADAALLGYSLLTPPDLPGGGDAGRYRASPHLHARLYPWNGRWPCVDVPRAYGCARA